MNFAEAVNEVLKITSRPDKAVDAALAINKAVHYCTLKGDFDADTVEASLPIDPALYGNTISIASLARFRRFRYVKPFGAQYYLSRTEGDKIFTPKNKMQPNVYYVAGTNLTYTLSMLAPTLEVSYLAYPVLLDAVVNNTHWMLDKMPYALVDLAAARIFAAIGDDSSARIHEQSGMDFFLTTRRDFAQP